MLEVPGGSGGITARIVALLLIVLFSTSVRLQSALAIFKIMLVVCPLSSMELWLAAVQLEVREISPAPG